MTESILCIPNRPEFEAGLSDFRHSLVKHAVFLPRTDTLEADEDWRQIIPYVVCWHRGRILTYRRQSGEGRLNGKVSIGFGGHVEKKADSVRDGRKKTLEPGLTITNAARREVREELGIHPASFILPSKMIVDDANAVGRVHLGLLYHATLTDEDLDDIEPEGSLCDVQPMMPGAIDATGLEGWSRMVLDWVKTRHQEMGVG